MKKVLGIFAIAATLVACDNAASSEQRMKDSMDSVKRVDSMNALAPTTPSMSDTGTTMPMGSDTMGGMRMGGDTSSTMMQDSAR